MTRPSVSLADLNRPLCKCVFKDGYCRKCGTTWQQANEITLARVRLGLTNVVTWLAPEEIASLAE